ncbi:CubicO group peptidase (beta-lactamase class C family) [Nocardioides luteus]|uniref:Serine hydrolase n=1 Tax=Nocardioides luteus TaxID=1844 RepID=A0ABQ5T057_9ACTN|nr:serine hydrolase domain-containing protein [Nocardioides luteus]MDR7310734.1 CubicO group peptidase (beta-lactamase class C family) [Nocardioides luteus]GGR40963.1 serine hydrolase [Nocardioides luteus]GLJ69486.1 serine hydrolase [Nocardioides luteus]
MTPTTAHAWLQDELPALLEKHRVPAAAVGVLQDGEVVDHASGILNLDTGVEATTDSLFQVGSITKLWTTDLVMQLVDEGRIDLDDEIQRHLPGFRVADEEAARTITVRHLLSHTAGFEGDVFTDHGPGDDAVERFVASMGDLSQIFAPGERFSYCNTGFAVLGRLVEVLREATWDRALQERLAAPLGLTHVATTAYDAIRFRAAMGHIDPAPDHVLRPGPSWGMARASGPVGAMLSMRVRDLLGYAAMHLADGMAGDGTRILSADACAEVLTRQVDHPASTRSDARGLGWSLDDLAQGIVGHDGQTIGQSAFFRVVPEQGVAVALLTNGGDTHGLYHDVVGRLLDELAGVRIAADPTSPDQPPHGFDAGRLLGTYRARIVDWNLRQAPDGRLWVEELPGPEAAAAGDKPHSYEVVPYAVDQVVTRHALHGAHHVFGFTGRDDSGRATHLTTSRVIPRASLDS